MPFDGTTVDLVVSRCVRGFWLAYDRNRYDGAPDAGPQCVGYGTTEDEAILDLMEQIEDIDWDAAGKEQN